jgi:hypothetical protein
MGAESCVQSSGQIAEENTRSLIARHVLISYAAKKLLPNEHLPTV